MAMAVGPFTTSEDLDFEPLAELLSTCRSSRPDVLLLVGPFIDVEHPEIASGAVDATFEDLFQTRASLLLFIALSGFCQM
jgi:DNA polymerase alpha subunit B